MKIIYAILTILVLVIIPINLAKAEPTLDCYKLENPITFDGKITSSDEWVDAPEIQLEYYGFMKIQTAYHPAYTNSGSVYLRVKHDGSNLYFLMDMADTTNPIGLPSINGWSFTGVFLDHDNDKSTVIQPDDSLQAVSWMTGEPLFTLIEGSTGGWNMNVLHEPVTVKHSMSTTAHSDQSHLVSEGKIPIGDAKEVGIVFLGTNLEEKEANAWPPDAAEPNPNTWGTLKLLSKTYRETIEPTITPTETLTTPIPTMTPTETPTKTETSTPTPTITQTPTSPTPSVTQSTEFDMNTIGLVAIIIIIIAVAAFAITKRKKS